jgi:NifU-like protein involved in Fe-S cluster formation
VSDPLYRREILRLAADAHGAGRLPTPTVTGAAFNPTCGDRVTVDLVLTGGSLTAIAHETKACVLAQASASILGASLAGKARMEVEALRNAVAAMLGEKRAAPESPFESYAAFDGVTEHAARHKCVLLPIDAVLDAFSRSESAEPGGERT